MIQAIILTVIFAALVKISMVLLEKILKRRNLKCLSILIVLASGGIRFFLYYRRSDRFLKIYRLIFFNLKYNNTPKISHYLSELL